MLKNLMPVKKKLVGIDLELFSCYKLCILIIEKCQCLEWLEYQTKPSNLISSCAIKVPKIILYCTIVSKSHCVDFWGRSKIYLTGVKYSQKDWLYSFNWSKLLCTKKIDSVQIRHICTLTIILSTNMI